MLGTILDHDITGGERRFRSIVEFKYTAPRHHIESVL